MPKECEGKLSAKGISFGLIASRVNKVISVRLLDGALDCLRRHGAEEEKMEIVWVPGAFEVPYAAQRMAMGGKYQALICLGAVIRGETPHFNFVATEVAKGVARVSLETGVPTIFGVVTADTLEQALERAGAKAGNRGWDAALSAIEMVNLFSII